MEQDHLYSFCLHISCLSFPLHSNSVMYFPKAEGYSVVSSCFVAMMGFPISLNPDGNAFVMNKYLYSSSV